MTLAKTAILSIFAVLITAAGAFAQAYQPFPAQWTYHFDYPDSASQSAGIWSVRVDSIAITNGDTTFFFNDIVRIVTGPDTLDCNGWDYVVYPGEMVPVVGRDNIFGASFRKFPNGRTECYGSGGGLWVIETEAMPGDSWLFDPQHGVTASLVAIENHSFMGLTDSVKVIALSSGPTLRLSKSHGFAETVAFIPMTSLTSYGEKLPASLRARGIDEIEAGRNLPGFAEIFGQFQARDVYQVSSSAHSSYGTSHGMEQYLFMSIQAYPSEYVCEIVKESLRFETIYSSPSGSFTDTTYSAPAAETVSFRAAEYPLLDLLPGEVSTGNWMSQVATGAFLLPDGRTQRPFAGFDDFNCSVLSSYSGWSGMSQTYVEGLGQTTWSLSEDYSGSSRTLTCHNTAVAGEAGICTDLRDASGLFADPEVTGEPGGLVKGLFGNANGRQLKLVMGEGALSAKAYDAAGRAVWQSGLQPQETSAAIDATAWLPGVYWMRVRYMEDRYEVFKTALLD